MLLRQYEEAVKIARESGTEGEVEVAVSRVFPAPGVVTTLSSAVDLDPEKPEPWRMITSIENEECKEVGGGLLARFNLPYHTTVEQMTGVCVGVVRAHFEGDDMVLKAGKGRRMLFGGRAPTLGLESEVLIGADPERRLYQVRSLEQFHSSNCGYHALHSAGLLIKAASSLDKDSAEAAVAEMTREDSFWKTTTILQWELKKAAAVRDSSIWKDKPIEGLLMETSYMDTIVGASEYCKKLGGRMAFKSLPFLELLERWQLERLDTVFRAGAAQKNWRLALLIGSYRHWVTAVINKVDGELEVILVDSANKSVLGKSDEDLVKLMTARIEESRPSLYRSWLRRPDIKDKSDAALNKIFVDGKGQDRVPPLYWRDQPAAIRIEEGVKEMQSTIRTLHILTAAAAGESTVSAGVAAAKAAMRARRYK